MLYSFKPQTVEELKERLPLALEDTYIQLDVARGTQGRPGLYHKHIFDFQDRVRLIISKEKEPTDRLVIHISSSINDDNDGHPLKLTDTHIHHIIEHIGLLFGVGVDILLIGISSESVAHFYIRLDN